MELGKKWILVELLGIRQGKLNYAGKHSGESYSILVFIVSEIAYHG